VRVSLVYLRPRLVGFVRSQGPYASSSAQAWQALRDWLDRHDLTGKTGCGYGLALDHPQQVAPENCRYEACIDLPAGYENLKTDGLSFQTLPGGAFARIRHVGPYNKVRASVALVRDTWLPDQPRLLADRRRPLLIVYLDDPKTCAANKLRCDVCVPVRTHHEDIMKRAMAAAGTPTAGALPNPKNWLASTAGRSPSGALR
jgi:AraC family transcriptional regulator